MQSALIGLSAGRLVVSRLGTEARSAIKPETDSDGDGLAAADGFHPQGESAPVTQPPDCLCLIHANRRPSAVSRFSVWAWKGGGLSRLGLLPSATSNVEACRRPRRRGPDFNWVTAPGRQHRHHQTRARLPRPVRSPDRRADWNPNSGRVLVVGTEAETPSRGDPRGRRQTLVGARFCIAPSDLAGNTLPHRS